MTPRRALAVACAVAVLTFQAPSLGARESPAAFARIPQLVLWAWERPEDLRGLSTDIGVAFLAQTITLESDRIAVAPRRQPLRVAPTTTLIAVTRIDVTSPIASWPLSVSDRLAALVLETATLPRIAALQIDFDATLSERALYRELLGRVRSGLNMRIPLSITALASWCADDRWLGGLPIDEAVPMLFRMGPTNQPFQRMASDRETAAPECRGAMGTSLDEPVPLSSGFRRVYVFNPRSWNELSIADARRQVRR